MSLTEDKREAVYQQIQSQKAELEAGLFQDATANALEWARKYHLNSRRERMVFKKVPYLTSLYTLIGTDTQMVVEKSVQCLPRGTLITTSNGYIPIEQIRIGALVLTHKGRYQRVMNVFSRPFSGKMFKHQAGVLPSIVSTEEHPFLVYSKDQILEEKTNWVEARDLTVNDLVGGMTDAGTLHFSRIKRHSEMVYKGTVHNLQVAEDESYIAGDYVVHNCGLSELFIINAHLEALRGLTVMYILPKYELRNRFVNNRVYKLHRHAPKYSELIRQGRAGGIHRTSMTHFGKGVIAYVGSNVESEFIEIPVDSIYVDEKDRCNLVNLELVPDRITASPYKHHREISNPTVEGFGIDERYQSSSQGMWNIKCEACGEHFVPDFFRHVVRQIGTRIWEPLDPEYNPEDEFQEIRLMCQCGAPVDRLKDGEWVHKYTKRIWQGYRISKIFNKVTTLRGLYDKWMDAQGNPTKTQIVYNSDLGLPFTAKGAKILEHELNACKRSYGIIRPEQATDRPRVMGIDVGADLHYIVRDLVMEQGVKCRRLLELGIVPTFKLLDEIVERWNPRIIVIDALPEIHKVQDFKTKHKNAWSSKFQQDQRKIAKNKNDRELSMDRTALLDYVQQSVNTETMLLPEEAEHLEHGEYYAHMKASTRILEIDQEKPDKSRFVWVHTMPDHFFLAEGYTFQGFLLLPNIEEVMGFFRSNTPRISTDGIDHIKGVSEEKRKELDRLARLTPDAVLTQMKKLHHGR